MLLYGWRTERFDWMKNHTCLALIAYAFITFLLMKLQDMQILYVVDPWLFLLYGGLVIMGTEIFMDHGLHFPQALSFAFNLAFFNSVYWETPIHIYTVLYHGYFDAAFPLHVIYVLPFFFLYQKTRFPKPHWKQYTLFFFGLLISTCCLVPVILFHNPDIWNNPLPLWGEMLWYLNRVLTYVVLCKLFTGGEQV